MMIVDSAQAYNRCSLHLDWLAKVASQAENHFWTTAVAEWLRVGSVSSAPLSVADSLCDGTQTSVQAMLFEAALILGIEDYDPTDYVVPLTNTLSPAAVSAVAPIIRDILQRALDLGSPPYAGFTHPAVSGAGDDMFVQVALQALTLGPKFPSPHTVFFPDTDVTGVEAEIAVDELETLILRVTGDSGTPAWAAGSNWHELAAGDTVAITAWGGGALAALLNVPMLVDSVADDELLLTLPVAASEVMAADPATGTAAKPGDVFILRKLRGVEPPS